jgi:hypothetical protein
MSEGMSPLHASARLQGIPTSLDLESRDMAAKASDLLAATRQSTSFRVGWKGSVWGGAARSSSAMQFDWSGAPS